MKKTTLKNQEVQNTAPAVKATATKATATKSTATTSTATKSTATKSRKATTYKNTTKGFDLSEQIEADREFRRRLEASKKSAEEAKKSEDEAKKSEDSSFEKDIEELEKCIKEPTDPKKTVIVSDAYKGMLAGDKKILAAERAEALKGKTAEDLKKFNRGIVHKLNLKVGDKVAAITNNAGIHELDASAGKDAGNQTRFKNGIVVYVHPENRYALVDFGYRKETVKAGGYTMGWVKGAPGITRYFDYYPECHLVTNSEEDFATEMIVPGVQEVVSQEVEGVKEVVSEVPKVLEVPGVASGVDGVVKKTAKAKTETISTQDLGEAMTNQSHDLKEAMPEKQTPLDEKHQKNKMFDMTEISSTLFKAAKDKALKAIMSAREKNSNK